MATVIRIKRRRDEDPAEVLLLSCKKRKDNDTEPSSSSAIKAPDLTSILKFAGTVESKDSGISKPVKEAIRKEKLEKTYKQRQTDILEQVRKQNRKQAQQGRYRITAKQRAEHLDKLDTATVDTCLKESEYKSDICDDNEKENENPKTDKKIESERNSNSDSNSPAVSRATDANKLAVNETKSEINELNKSNFKDFATLEEERQFCLLDVETDLKEEIVTSRPELDPGLSDITCNNVPMVREEVSERGGDEEYVYDLYYTNSAATGIDFHSLGNMLTIQPFDNIYLDSEDHREGREDLYDEDEDSNDEGNWRNDYPDEDPDEHEPNEESLAYPNDMSEYAAFDTEDGDQLAEWMSWRCNIEDDNELSSDDDALTYGQHGYRSYDAYYRHVSREMQKYDKEVNIENDSDLSDSD